ncbi:MAG: EAL domain-containing protein, partial [Burkholderiaceae bacterium]
PVFSRHRVEALIALFASYGTALISHWETGRAAATASEKIRRFAHIQATTANETDALLHAIIDDLPGLVALKDEQGRYLMANRTLAELYGKTPADMVGRLDEELQPEPEHPACAQRHSLDVLASGATQVVDQAMIDQSSGRERHFRLTKRPFTGARGEQRLLIVGQEISELLQAQVATRQAKNRLEFALGIAGDAVWEWDIESGRIIHNEQWRRTFDAPNDGFEHSYAEFISLIHPDDRERFRRHCAAVDADDKLECEHRMETYLGRKIWVRVRGRVSERNPSGRALKMIGRITDITAERATAEAQRIAAVAFESQEGMIVTDRHARILRVNHAFTELTGYSAEEAIGHTPSLLRSGRHDATFYMTMWQQIAATGRWQGEVWNRRKNGDSFPEWLTITAVRDEIGAVSHYVGAFLDITEQKEAQTRISHLAFYDPLTGLPNRRLLLERLPQTTSEHRRSGQYGALIFLDIDHFKTLNDTLGHDVGDQFLRLVAQRLKQLVRETDTVARLGGDEFVILLPQLGTAIGTAVRVTATLAQKLCTALGQPYELDNRMLYSSASLGICLFPAHENAHEDAAESLLKQADLALYKAKGAGRNQIRFYSPELQAAVDQRAQIEAGLHQALEQHQFELHFQPQIDADGHAIGAEALLRWRTAAGDWVMPNQFIAIAEDTGLIVPIGNWVIDTACAQLARWSSDPVTARLSLSINISERQTRQADFVQTVSAAVSRHRIDPYRLKLELTESLVIADIDQIVAKMLALRRIGVQFSMDDFGTGYSSLSALHQLPLEQIKIDQSFVRGLGSQSEDGVIVRAIIAMSRSLQLRVLAEGVETEAEFAVLRELGCDAYQGFLFGRPLPVAAFEQALRERHA